jgi:acetyl-CoA synthetase
MSTRLVFDLKEKDVLWCTAGMDWITGHTYGVYGPLACGLTSVLFEGAPSFPDPGEVFRVISKHRVNVFYTTPNLIRTLARGKKADPAKHDLSSLKALGSVGEPLAPEMWEWFFHHVGRGECPVLDTWWQTETGGHMIAPFAGATPLKAGSCTLPFFGVDPVILDMDTGREVQYPEQEGALFIRGPWPGMARTIYGDHERFREAYFSMAPGMFFTGDGAKCDADGYFWIRGRIDDVITISNQRICTAEMESVLVRQKDVAEAAVVGVVRPDGDREICVFAALSPGAVRSDELREELAGLVKNHIGPFVRIDRVYFADSLPKTMSGKILHRLLLKIASGLADEFGDTSTLADPGVLDALIKEHNRIMGSRSRGA